MLGRSKIDRNKIRKRLIILAIILLLIPIGQIFSLMFLKLITEKWNSSLAQISLLLLVILVFAFVQVIMNTTKVVTKIFILYNIYAMASYIITMIVTFANIYRVEGLLDDNVPVYKVRDFLYFSIITWTTTGYGDIKPSPDSRIFAAAEALIGYMTMGLFLAIAFYIISSRGKYRNIRRDDRKPSRISSEDAEGKDGKAL